MKLYEIYFSPTGGTKKVADCLSKQLSENVLTFDLVKDKENSKMPDIKNIDVAVIAVPSYGGRVPKTAAERISKITGNGAKAIIVCVYGNRAYEDTLIELQDLVKKSGFKVIAAVAAVAEHSIARNIANGRPDTEDVKSLLSIAQKIKDKIYNKDDSEPMIPGNRPYKKSGSVGLVPKPTSECVQCGLCAKECPVDAIDKENTKIVNNKKCISCMRCISVCPNDARKVNRAMLFAVNMMLKKACASRKECELYI